MRLIDADLLSEAIYDNVPAPYEDASWAKENCLAEIEAAPTVDAVPVRHGRWIEPSRLYYGAKQYECSLCYSDTFWKKHSITEKYPHCPNCGATMDLED